MLRDFIFNYKTKYSDGFMDSELNEIIKSFNIDIASVHKSLFGNTCSSHINKETGENEIVNYHSDVYFALRGFITDDEVFAIIRKIKINKIIKKI